MLEKAGHRVDVAGNGREVLEMLLEKPYDMVFMDVQMPEMDGYETTRAIRTMANEFGRLPVIAMTAHAMKGDRDKCIAAGMDDYLSKPVNSKELSEMVQRWAGKKVFRSPDGGSGSRCRLPEEGPRGFNVLFGNLRAETTILRGKSLIFFWMIPRSRLDRIKEAIEDGNSIGD